MESCDAAAVDYASGRKRSRRARGGYVSVRGKGAWSGDAPPDHFCVADAITLREAARRGMRSPGRRTVEIEQRRARNRAWATPVGTREAGSRTGGFLDGSGAPLRFRNRASLSRGRSKQIRLSIGSLPYDPRLPGVTDPMEHR